MSLHNCKNWIWEVQIGALAPCLLVRRRAPCSASRASNALLGSVWQGGSPLPGLSWKAVLLRETLGLGTGRKVSRSSVDDLEGLGVTQDVCLSGCSSEPVASCPGEQSVQ